MASAHVPAMHVLASHNRSEFLSCPQLIRFDYPKGRDGHEPTLLIKASTLLLKYIARGVRMQLAFSRLDNRLLYALKVFDDPEAAAVLWSILERDEEKAALEALAKGEPCQVFLYNEIAVNVAWSEVSLSVADTDLTTIDKGAATGRVDHAAIKNAASAIIDRFHRDGASSADIVVVDIAGTTDWKPVRNTFITSGASSSLLDLFAKDEGNQQEQIGVWLTDNLHPLGVHHSPQIPKGNGFRELADILLSYQYGSIVIESKSISILLRDALPDRAKLAHDITAHITKAVGQLKGGIRMIKSGTPVTSKAGGALDIERTQPIHGIVLIPDLDLIENPKAYDLALLWQIF